MHTCHQPGLVQGLNELSEEEALHVSRVLRMKQGAQVRLVDGHGKVASGVVVDVGKKAVRVEVEEMIVEASRPQGLSLVVSPTKQSDRFEWLIEKATELGVDKIIPVWTQRSERRIDKHARWQKVVVSATKQCQRIWMPVLAEACNVSDLFESHPELLKQRGAVAHCMPTVDHVPDRVSWSDFQSSLQQAWIAIGPEGDFASEEVQALHAKGATPVNLGSQRLRTETAGMAAVARFNQRVH